MCLLHLTLPISQQGGWKSVTFCAACQFRLCEICLILCMFPEVTGIWPFCLLVTSVLYQKLWHRTQQLTGQNLQRYRRNSQVYWHAKRRTQSSARPRGARFHSVSPVAVSFHWTERSPALFALFLMKLDSLNKWKYRPRVNVYIVSPYTFKYCL